MRVALEDRADGRRRRVARVDDLGALVVAAIVAEGIGGVLKPLLTLLGVNPQ